MIHISPRVALRKDLASGAFALAFVASLLTVPISAPLAAQPAQNQGTAVFKIGEFNRSSIELAQGDAKQKIDYVVGQSTAAKDWYSSQRVVFAPADASEPAAAPRTISFTVEHPAPSYDFHLAFLIKGTSVPAVEIGVNGKMGRFYLHPKLNYDNGDQNDAFDAQYSSADVEFSFPGSFMHAGANAITVEAVENAEVPIHDAQLTWDALELDSSAAAAPRAVTAQIEPTIFFQQQNGVLCERVDAFMRSGRRVGAGGSADLLIAGKHYREALKGGYDFGEERVEFLVPEFPAQTQAQLRLTAPGVHQQFNQAIDPEKKWTVWIVPHIHVDIGYSDYQAKVAAIQARTIDEAMEMTANHPDFRFSLDGYWDLEQFLKTRTDADRQRAIEAIKKQQIFIPAQYANLLTGLPTAETLIRSLYPSADFARRYGTPFNYANITDVPSYSWSYASILAAAGIPYFAAGSDNYRAPVLLQGRLNEDTPMWWEGPDGKHVMLWYSRHYMQMQILFGLPPVVTGARDTLPLYLQMFEHPNYRASSTIVFGTQVENTDLFPEQASFAGTWNKIYAYPHMQYSGFHEALAEIEKEFGGDLPTIRGDGGPYWEDGAGSDAYYEGMERWNETRALTAEKLATLTRFTNPSLAIGHEELNRMWTNMVLMDEHTWDSYNSVSDHTSQEAVQQLAIKDQFAVNAHAQADFIVKRSMANLTDAIPAGPGSLIVFNTLNWKRSGLVSVDLPNGDEIVDTQTGQTVPFEVLTKGHAFHHVRFTAEEVPAVGYKVYKLRRSEQPLPTAATEQTTTLESPYYTVTLDAATGAVRSIFDKQLNRELVNQQSPYRFGQYLYVTGGDKTPNQLIQYSHVTPRPELTIHAAESGQIVSVERTPFGTEARMRSQDVNTPSIETTILLFDHEKKIEIIENVDKKAVTTKEAAYFAFPFDFSAPRFQYEIQTGVVDPAKDMYPGAGHEWFTVQHWVAAEQDGASAAILPLDAPLVTLGDINRGLWPEQFGQRPGTIFSYIMNNYWDTNYRAEQGGHFHFHYIVTSAASTQPAELSRMGWEEMTPLEYNFVTTQDKAVSRGENDAEAGGPVGAGSIHGLSGKQDSFLSVSDPGVLLETWKPAEDGHGTILRFLDFAGTERTVTVHMPWIHLDSVSQTDAVERGATPVTMDGDQQFQFTLHPHEIVTIRAVAQGK
jgi:alpha-mannosidase